MRLTEQQIQNTKDLLIEHRGEDVTGMSLSQLYYQRHGESIDWHEFSSLLSTLRQQSFLLMTGYTSSRMTLYRYVGELQ